MSDRPPRAVTILIAALGGEGGGVLADWLLAAARSADFPVQSTSIPGVAQRTGATTYYLELYPVPATAMDDVQPVFALTPSPGNVDLMAATELVEAGRALQNGYVTPDRTTLVASTHRVFATSEKMHGGDGRYPAARVVTAAGELARQAVLFDMAALAQSAGAVINAVLFGAIAGSGVLPLSRDACEAAIRGEGKGGEASLRGFAAGYEAACTVAAGQAGGAGGMAASVGAPVEGAVGGASGSAPGVVVPTGDLPQSALASFPPSARSLVLAGWRRVVDFQDRRYGQLYVDRLSEVARTEAAAGGDGVVSRETARYLALWMSYEDVIRVADLKTRPERFARVRAEVRAGAGEPVTVVDYLKPGAEEVAAVLPPAMAGAVRRWALRGGRDRLARPVELTTSALGGYAALRVVAALRRWRPVSSRYREEQAAIERWLANVRAALARSPELALAIVECARLRKGYGDTHERGRASFEGIQTSLVEGAPELDDAARAAALARACDAALRESGGREATGRPAGASAPQPVVWTQRRHGG